MARVIIKAKILFCNQYSVIKLILIFWRYASGRVTKQENYNDLCGLWPCFRPFYPLSGTAFQQVYAGNAGLCAVSNPQAVRSVSRAKRAGNPEYRRLMTRYRMRASAGESLRRAISYLAAERFSDVYIVWYLGLIWTLLLLTEIDNRMMLLPDILTVPLLIAGFAYSVFVSQWVIPAGKRARRRNRLYAAGGCQRVSGLEKQGRFRGRRHQTAGGSGRLAGYGAGNIYDDFGQRAVCAVCAGHGGCGSALSGRRLRLPQ